MNTPESHLAYILILCAIAAIEATPIGYLIPGTLAVVGAGSLV